MVDNFVHKWMAHYHHYHEKMETMHKVMHESRSFPVYQDRGLVVSNNKKGDTKPTMPDDEAKVFDSPPKMSPLRLQEKGESRTKANENLLTSLYLPSFHPLLKNVFPFSVHSILSNDHTRSTKEPALLFQNLPDYSKSESLSPHLNSSLTRKPDTFTIPTYQPLPSSFNHLPPNQDFLKYLFESMRTHNDTNDEAIPLLVGSAKKKRTKVTDTRLSPRAARVIINDNFNYLPSPFLLPQHQPSYYLEKQKELNDENRSMNQYEGLDLKSQSKPENNVLYELNKPFTHHFQPPFPPDYSPPFKNSEPHPVLNMPKQFCPRNVYDKKTDKFKPTFSGQLPLHKTHSVRDTFKPNESHFYRNIHRPSYPFNKVSSSNFFPPHHPYFPHRFPYKPPHFSPHNLLFKYDQETTPYEHDGQQLISLQMFLLFIVFINYININNIVFVIFFLLLKS